LNVIVSGLSSPEVLTTAGFLNFSRSIGFSSECLGVHLGSLQSANLGDGHGSVNQSFELRDDFGSSSFGTCLESLVGGNHFRGFPQNGPSANSGAMFLAVSKEENVLQGHTISPNGYNLGRDSLVAAAVGSTSFNGVTYKTTSEQITGLLPAGSQGINHGIAQDGVVVLLTVAVDYSSFQR
jgi:hypothetical protein